MKTVTEGQKEVPVILETDVVVVGGGPAGIAAAVAAAREGVQVAIVERAGFFGGNITQTMVESLSWYRHEKTVEAGGILFELEDMARGMGATMADFQSTGVILDTELFKCVTDGIIKSSGVTPLLHCFAADAIKVDDAVAGIFVESKSGRGALLGKRVIDASGDADIAHRARVECSMAPTKDLMEVTANFACGKVDVESFIHFLQAQDGKVKDWATKTGEKENNLPLYWFKKAFDAAKEAGEIPADVFLESYWSGGHTDSGDITNLNAVHIAGIDPTSVWDMTKAEMEGRQRILYALKALRKHMPGFENARLRSFAPFVGVRESRKILGTYSITGQDVMNEARFQDSIGVCPEFLDAFGIVILPTTGRYFQIPFGIMLPRSVENLLVAGRSVAGDRISHAATRQMVCCTATGQGAGVAAAVSIKDGNPLRNVNIGKVQKALEKQGVRVR